MIKLTFNNKISKIISAVLIISIAAPMVGCGEKNIEDAPNVVNESSDSPEKKGETIKMITWTNDSTIEALNIINDKFYKEYGIRIELTDVPATDYEDLLKERIETGDVDIFCYTTDSKAFAQQSVDWAPSDMLTWEKIITDGDALDLSTNKFVENWGSGAQACRYNDGIYGIATGMTIMNGLFYNKKLFDQKGWSEPKTWDEFCELCEKIKEDGMAPITVGGADTWPVQMITNAIVDSVEEGKCDELSEGLWNGTRKYTDNKSMEVYRREQQILTYLEDDFLKIPYSDGPKRFVEGKAAMLYDGSWNAAEIEKADPDFEYDYFPIPGDESHMFTGKYDLTFGIYAKSGNTDKAVKWLEFFSTPENYTIFINYNGFVPTMSWISTSNKFLVLIDDRLNDAKRTYECYNRVPSDMGPYGTYDLINYEQAGGVFKTPEEFANAAQKDWDEAIAKAKTKTEMESESEESN